MGLIGLGHVRCQECESPCVKVRIGFITPHNRPPCGASNGRHVSFSHLPTTAKTECHVTIMLCNVSWFYVSNFSQIRVLTCLTRSLGPTTLWALKGLWVQRPSEVFRGSLGSNDHPLNQLSWILSGLLGFVSSMLFLEDLWVKRSYWLALVS